MNDDEGDESEVVVWLRVTIEDDYGVAWIPWLSLVVVVVTLLIHLI